MGIFGTLNIYVMNPFLIWVVIPAVCTVFEALLRLAPRRRTRAHKTEPELALPPMQKHLLNFGTLGLCLYVSAPVSALAATSTAALPGWLTQPLSLQAALNI